MTSAVKLIPLMLAWTAMVTLLSRYYFARRRSVLFAVIAGFSAGTAGALLLLANLRGDLPYAVIKTATGFVFLLFWANAIFCFYRATGGGSFESGNVETGKIPGTYGLGAIFFAGTLAGAISAGRLMPQGSGLSVPLLVLLLLTAGVMVLVASSVEKLIPPRVVMTRGALLSVTVALLLFSSSFSLRLDLFSPLTMKVMKFIHDFVHQFFESMLIPDHPFFRPDVWQYIGYLFSSGVGFWGGLIVWLAPAFMMILAIRLEPLPAVSHVRQGARRRKLLAAFIMDRRYRLVVPSLALLILAAAVYQSRFPAVEYWDPKPLPVSPDSVGRILIPKKGEVDLEDGRLHKYVSKHGGREARFFIMMTPAGKLTVTLDACAICKPEGYGQTEGSIICYYCKTLIPLETVGKPGGCNPVPVSFRDDAGRVEIDASLLQNSWSSTVSATLRSEGEGK